MSKNRKHDQKQPRAFSSPSASKTPRATSTPSEQCRLDIRTDQMDMDGPWGWHNFDPLHIKDLIQKILEYQKMTWQELRPQGSHLIYVATIIPEAQKRLRALKKDDTDQLYSLRVTGSKRVWGIKENNILWLLWWDPEHTVCPSNAKNN